MLWKTLSVATASIALTIGAWAAEDDADLVTSTQNLTQTTCSDLGAQSEDERTVALIFYYGYLAGLSGAVTIDESRVSDQLIAVRDFCNAHADATIIAAFVAALKSAK